MNTISSCFSKSWIRRVLALVALGAVLMAVQQGMLQRHCPAVQSASPAPIQETPALPDPSAEAKLPSQETPVVARSNEPSSVSAGTNVVVRVSYTVSDQAIAPPLARAVRAGSSAVSVSVDSSEYSGTPTVDPPLVFTVEPRNLTHEQQTALAAIQDQFLKAIGDVNQDPADPEYRKRWMTAQFIADQTYRALFGWPVFSQMQLERARSTYTEIQQP